MVSAKKALTPADLKDRNGENLPLVRWRFIERVADACGLNLVADHYTVSELLESGEGGNSTLESLLSTAAKSYHSVFRLEDNYLLARRVSWPEDSVGEPPYPLAEQWIATKEKKQPLAWEEWVDLAALKREHVAVVGAYDDGAVHFKRELEFLREFVPGGQAFIAGFGSLKDTQKKALISAEGIAVSELPGELRTRLYQAARGVPKAPDDLSQLRLCLSSLVPARAGRPPNMPDPENCYLILMVPKAGFAGLYTASPIPVVSPGSAVPAVAQQ